MSEPTIAQAVSYNEGGHNTVSAIVDHVKFKKFLPDQMWQWLLEMALWHLRELKLSTWQQPKSVLLDVTDRKTVILPKGFLDWTKVGCKVGQYVITLGVNDELATTARNTSDNTIHGLLSQHLPNGLNANNYTGYYFFNYNGSSLWSLGGGFLSKGFFKVHETKFYKELLLDYDYNHDQIYLEYITDGFEPCGETIVDPYFADYVKKGIEFSWEEGPEPNKTEASIDRKAREFRDALKLVRARKNNLDRRTLLNIGRSGFRFTAKV